MTGEDDFPYGSAWRQLYEELDAVDHRRSDVRPMLERWLREHPRHVAEVREAGEAENHRRPLEPRRAPHYTTTERLYALSRVLDELLLSHQAASDDPALGAFDDADLAPREAYTDFCAGLGAEPIAVPDFHPFFHEVVEVRQAEDPQEPPSIRDERWPGYVVGSMLLVRSGVVVRAGADWLLAGVADRSVLYWTFRRRGRHTRDLSHDWGSNSQWSTSFRRDYVVDGRLHYNVDAAIDEPTRPAEPPDPGELDAAAMTEVVRYRCSTVVDHGNDVYPYDHHHVEPAPTAP